MEFHKILIAIDGSKSSEKVAKSGFELAKQFDSEVALVSIVAESEDDYGNLPTPKEIEDMKGSNCNRGQRHVIETVFKDYPVKTFVKEGQPAEVIIKIAELWKADVIVMGTHGRKGFSHLMMGSVAEEVIRGSKKTTVVIPIFDS